MKIFQKTKFLLFVRIANVKNSTSEKTRKLNRPKKPNGRPYFTVMLEVIVCSLHAN